MTKTTFQTEIFRFSDAEKHQMIQEMLSTGCSKRAIWKKYTGRDYEHGKILEWMRYFGYKTSISLGTTSFESNFEPMAKKKSVKTEASPDPESFENLQLKKRISELEKQLKDAELKAIAFSTMIDIAEKELKIPIRKKYNTKP